MKRTLWIINSHTQKCYGPYDTPTEAMQDILNDPHPEDWALVREIAKPLSR